MLWNSTVIHWDSYICSSIIYGYTVVSFDYADYFSEKHTVADQSTKTMKSFHLE